MPLPGWVDGSVRAVRPGAVAADRRVQAGGCKLTAPAQGVAGVAGSRPGRPGLEPISVAISSRHARRAATRNGCSQACIFYRQCTSFRCAGPRHNSGIHHDGRASVQGRHSRRLQWVRFIFSPLKSLTLRTYNTINPVPTKHRISAAWAMSCVVFLRPVAGIFSARQLRCRVSYGSLGTGPARRILGPGQPTGRQTDVPRQHLVSRFRPA